MEIKFPIVCYSSEKLVVAPAAFMDVVGGKFTKEGTFLRKECFIQEKPFWIMDFEGNLFVFSQIRKRNSWLRPLSFLWRFTQTEFSVNVISDISIENFIEILGKCKKNQCQKDLIRHLKKYDKNNFVSQAILVAWPI